MTRTAWILVLVTACAQPDPEFVCTDDASCGDGGRCEAVGFCSFDDATCDKGRRFSEHSGELASTCVKFSTACRVSADAELLWEVDLPEDAQYFSQDDVPYQNDVRADFTGSFRRVGYCLTLDDQHAYAEFDDFTGGDIDATGIPTEDVHQQAITNLTVRSNVVGDADTAVGGIEFWPHCYDEGDDGRYDATDLIGSENDCYGSLQIFHGTDTVFSYNHWAGPDVSIDDVGIGNAPQEPDWTFAQNASKFSRRFLQAFVVR